MKRYGYVKAALCGIIALFLAIDHAYAADSYTANLRIVQQVSGTNANTWGIKANAAFAMLDEAISKVTSISLTAGNVTLSTANNATDQSRSAVLVFTGTPGTTRTVTAPNLQKLYYVYNNSDSTLTFGAGGGTTIPVDSGSKAAVYTDGATNAVALTNITSFSAGVLDDSSAAGWRSTIGVAASGANTDITSLALTAASGIIQSGSNALLKMSVTNSNAGNASGAESYHTNGAGITEVGILGTGFTTSGIFRQAGGYLITSGAGGLTLGTSAAQPIYLATNNADRVQIGATGLVGIGMTPVNVLDITQTQNAASKAQIYNNNGSTAASVGFYAVNNTPSSLVMRIMGGSFTPSGIDRADGAQVTGSGAGGLTIGTTAAQPIYGVVGGAEAWRTNVAGELQIGSATDQGAFLLQVNSQIWATNATISTSDLRLKNVLGNPTDKLMDAARRVPTIMYTRKDRPDDGERFGYGAQTWQAAFSEAGYHDTGIVVTGPDGRLSLDEDAVQTLKIAALERENAELRGRIVRLESLVMH